MRNVTQKYVEYKKKTIFLKSLSDVERESRRELASSRCLQTVSQILRTMGLENSSVLTTSRKPDPVTSVARTVVQAAITAAKTVRLAGVERAASEVSGFFAHGYS